MPARNPAPASTNGAAPITLTRDEKAGRKFTKFTTGPWVSGQVNATVYVPNDAAVKTVTITVHT